MAPDAPPIPPRPALVTVAAPTGRRVRARLARLGAQRPSSNPVLEPLFRSVRQTHPKADLRMIERAYEVAERYHRGQKRKSGDPYITHPLAVATILAELGMTPPTLCAALLHDTVEDTAVHARRAAQGLRRRGRAPGRRRHQARQGQVRRGGAGRDRPQDGRRDGPRHPGAGDQARRPAAQHAHASSTSRRRRPSGRRARRWRSTRRWPTGWA